MELVILCGLQASGKTTFRRTHLGGHAVVSKDLMPNNRRKDARQRELIGQSLSAGAPVVVDNTNPSPEDRLPLIALGREFGVQVVGYYFDLAFAECVERNANRPEAQRVPYVGLVDAARRLVPPRASEGYAALWVVRPVDGRFDVAAPREDAAP